MLISAILATAIASCGQVPVQELVPIVQNADFAAVISSQAAPIVSNTPSSVQISFNTSMDKTSTERAINLYTGTIDSSKNPASFNALQLTSMCNGTWRVRNTNAVPISFDWMCTTPPKKVTGL